MFIHQIALVSQSGKINISDLTKASAALQKQATKDLAPFNQFYNGGTHPPGVVVFGQLRIGL